MDPFIRLYPSLIEPGLCTAIVDRFRADARRHPGHVGTGRSAVKRSTDLEISRFPEWGDLCLRLDQAVGESVRRYRADVPNFAETHRKALHATEYQLQCYEPNGTDGFDWHCDVASRDSAERVLALIVYLNDVAEGGETEFRTQQVSVAPRQGSVLWFPPTFSYVHRGAVPRSEAKYIITGFLVYP